MAARTPNNPAETNRIADQLIEARSNASEALFKLIRAKILVDSYFDQLGMDVDDGDFDTPPRGVESLVDLWVRTPTEIDEMALDLMPEENESSYPRSFGEFFIGERAKDSLAKSTSVNSTDFDTVFAVAQRGDEIAMKLIGMDEGDGK